MRPSSQSSPSPEFFLVAPPASFACAAVAAATVTFDSYSLNPANTIEFGFGTIPLLTETPCLPPPPSAEAEVEIWQHSLGQDPAAHPQNSSILPQNQNDPDLQFGGGVPESSTATCQDCGNQAKKDCTHRRCRTCCKSRGYNCPTHVKSTWIPSAGRGTKKPRHGGALEAALTTPISGPMSSHQDLREFIDSLPEKVVAPAVFKCVRVSAVNHVGEYGYAYEAVVTINGHVFKGFLYDQGVGGREGLLNLSQLHLGGVEVEVAGNCAASHVGNPCSNFNLDPNDIM